MSYHHREFIFPSMCCRCAVHPSTEKWLVVGQTPKPTHEMTIRKGIHSVLVPICENCRKELERAQRAKLVAFFGTVGLGALLATGMWLGFMDLNEAWFAGAVLGGMAGLIATCFGIWPMISAHTNSTVCHVLDDGRVLMFDNPEYQELFDQINVQESSKT